jgi:hypothetical protein
MADLTPEQEILAAHMTATMTALKILILMLEANGAVESGQYQPALFRYMENSKDVQTPETLALLSDLREALLD